MRVIVSVCVVRCCAEPDPSERPTRCRHTPSLITTVLVVTVSSPQKCSKQAPLHSPSLSSSPSPTGKRQNKWNIFCDGTFLWWQETALNRLSCGAWHDTTVVLAFEAVLANWLEYIAWIWPWHINMTVWYKRGLLTLTFTCFLMKHLL